MCAAKRCPKLRRNLKRLFGLNSHNGRRLAQLADLLVQEEQSDKAIARAQGYLVGNPAMPTHMWCWGP